MENVLGRVVDAFEAQVASVLGGSAAGRLACSLPTVQLMVKEPAAALLGSPVAFFVGRNTGGSSAGLDGGVELGCWPGYRPPTCTGCRPTYVEVQLLNPANK